MKVKKLLERLNDFLTADEKTQQQEIEGIRKVLKALKDKEKDIRRQLENSSDAEEADALQTKLDVIYAQRSKGVEHVKQLRGSEHADKHD
jgi:predicted ribosome quality control (RQC) complex YloA/Tae2 family protein